jgi:hypothetical protein
MILHIVPALALLFSSTVSPWPLTGFNHIEQLAKRLDKPPVPGASDLRAHLGDVPSGTCLFYTGGTLTAAQQYADDHDLYILADLDNDGWAAPSDKYPDEEGEDDYNPECPMSWAFQKQYDAAGVGWGAEERDAYFDSLSEAFAQKCNGDVTLALPPSQQIPADSVFARVEWPVLQFNPTVTVLRAIVLNQGDDADGTLVSGPTDIWTRCEST